MSAPHALCQSRSRSRLLPVAASLTALALGAAAHTPAHAAPAGPDEWEPRTPPLTTPWTDQVGPDNALPDYPRPQLARPSAAAPTWTNLNGVWQYQSWDGFSPIRFGHDLDGTVLVPYPTESALSGQQRHDEYMLYRRTVSVPKAYTAGGKRVRLNFGAVNYGATVYVNGTKVATHTGAYDAFSADVTDALTRRGPQEIVVAVHSPVDDDTIPVGKQRNDPGGIFYTAASGIWQTVWLEPVQPTSIASVTATPDVDTSSFDIDATYHGAVGNARLRVQVLADGKVVARGSGAASGGMRLSVRRPHLWTPDDPFLYTFRITLTKGGVSDTVESYAGLREIGVEKIGGKQRITLNHRQTYLMSTLDQGYWPDGIYTAPTDEALRFDIEKTKELGFNTIRKHIKVEPARWYYWADKLGMMVWQDMPALPTGRNDRLTTAQKADFRSETRAMVGQLQNSTSIIGWIPFNEGWGQWSVPAATELAEQITQQDPSRLVNARSGANCCDTPGDPGSGDIIDWHAYQGPALPAPDATRASIDGEHGGLTLAVPGHSWPGADVNPYGAVPDAAALTAGYVANTAVLRDQGAPYGLSGSVYTQITDVEGEQNGFYTYDRRVLKVSDPAAVRTVNLQTIAAGAKAAPTPPAGTPGLQGVGAWTFDEGQGNTAADSAGRAPLTLTGGYSWVDGQRGQAVHFDGTGAGTTTQTVVRTDARNYTASAWVKFDEVGGAFQTILSEDGERNSAFFLQYSGADRRLAFSFAGTRALASGVTVQPDRWYHVVGVRDFGASTLTVYVDGQRAGQASVLGNPDVATGPLAVGRGRYDGRPVDYLTGSVDSARVYDRALSASEVTALYRATGPAGQAARRGTR